MVKKNRNQQEPAASTDPFNEHVSHTKFTVAFMVQHQSITTQASQYIIILVNPTSTTITVRVQYFTWINHPKLYNSKTKKDIWEIVTIFKRLLES